MRKASVELGLQFLAEVRETLSLLATQPEMGWACRLRSRQFRSIRVFRVSGPFDRVLISYRPASGCIHILRVLLGRQDLEVRFGSGGLDL